MHDRLLHPHIAMQHSLDIQPRFSDFDMFGHVNNNAFMAYFDIGKTAFFNHILGKMATPADISAVIVNIDVDFLEPALSNQQLAVSTAIVNIGNKSFTLYQRVFDSRSLHVKAQATTTLAGFDISSQSTAPLSPVLSELLRLHLTTTE